jgi:hypothetical protein
MCGFDHGRTGDKKDKQCLHPCLSGNFFLSFFSAFDSAAVLISITFSF